MHNPSSEPMMSKETFSDFVTTLAYHFGQDKFVTRGEATKKRLSSWYEQVNHIPEDLLPWMADQIKSGNEYFPRNLSKTILELWNLWLKQNPNKIHKGKGAEGCRQCFWGWLVAWREIDDRWHSQAFKCGHCQSVTTRDGETATRRSLADNGWWVEPKDYKPGDEKNTPWHRVIRQSQQTEEAM